MHHRNYNLCPNLNFFLIGALHDHCFSNDFEIRSMNLYLLNRNYKFQSFQIKYSHCIAGAQNVKYYTRKCMRFCIAFKLLKAQNTSLCQSHLVN